ncbi:hypothetical protein [Staphylococcus americanisciuri]|uniref:Uncharacterized protein n=1 Tax=Staphylococcus americanisciuri TaxID=2973940 RepID=A0ABT2F2Q2_9STAP|nr:hypothetical protein [Staphylococcus americanisciuri]MCS4486551.1 hypothetical protein [Staphylococcus americanisciuri]
MSTLTTILTVMGIVALQYFMASRKHFLWGAIIPIAYVFTMIYLYLSNYYNSLLSFILFLSLGLIFLFEEWNRGRKDRRKKENNELNKMKKKDL